MENPKVTIYIPTKNRLALLKKAVDSVLRQTYTNWELIVVNDASTDGTKDYLDDLSKSNPKVKVIHHHESLGACVSRNDAIFSATGTFITGLDDDYIHSELLRNSAGRLIYNKAYHYKKL
ncbi:MAG: glycosyltransferase [Weeksellaceae bacterium]|nr:glycosyltransferase [Weeksellaceae bacterium]